jgi:hypothetical protein
MERLFNKKKMQNINNLVERELNMNCGECK